MPVETPAPIKKKAYHHGDLRNAIVIQAVARARNHGESAIVLREIASDIGVSATAAYRHFTNRAELVSEIAAKGYAALAERLELPSVTDGGEQPTGDRAGLAAYLDLRNTVVELTEFSAEEGPWCTLMIDQLGASPVVAESATVTHDLVDAILRRGATAGTLRSGVEIGEDRMFWAGVNGMSTLILHRLFPGETATEILGSERGRMIDKCTEHLLTDAGRTAVAAAGPVPDRVVADLSEWTEA